MANRMTIAKKKNGGGGTATRQSGGATSVKKSYNLPSNPKALKGIVARKKKQM